MGKKALTIEYAREILAERGYELLETKYKNVTTKMRYRCPKHPNKELSIRLGDIKKGSGCPFCADNNIKHTFEYVRQCFEKRGYELLEDVYKNRKTKMRYRCPKHPDKELSIRLASIKEGKGCPWCAGQGQLTLEEARELFSGRGYILLETEYKNSATRMRYICPNHPDKNTEISVAAIQRGYRCSYCAGSAKHTIEYARECFAERGYELLDAYYVNSRTKMKYRCEHHADKITEICLCDLLGGHGCPYCAGRGNGSLSEAKYLFAERGYELLEKKYINSATLMAYKCKKHPDKALKSSLANLKNKKGCPFCAYENQSGEGNYNWGGGVSGFDKSFRGYVNRWRKSILQKHDSTCFVSGIKVNRLHVHHVVPFRKLKESMRNELGIEIKKTIGEYTREEAREIKRYFLKAHEELEGVPLLPHLHLKFHSVYGEDATKEDLLKFKEDYLAGVYEEEKTGVI